MKVLSVVETAIYVDDLDAAEEFYQRVLGLNVIARELSVSRLKPKSNGRPEASRFTSVIPQGTRSS
jgi:catechol 2,3-dioxygenase-like lactoylglutathione lyase family enzyme